VSVLELGNRCSTQPYTARSVNFDPKAPPAGQRYFFHYTDCPSAASICDEGVYHVSKGGICGPGMYVTDIAPERGCFEELKRVIFGLHSADLYQGVVAVVDSDPPSFFIDVDERVWKHDGAADEDIQLEGLALAHGCWDGAEWAWHFATH